MREALWRPGGKPPALGQKPCGEGASLTSLGFRLAHLAGGR